MRAMLVKSGEKSLPEAFGEAVRQQVMNPDPGERAETDFERARPIDPSMQRILIEPTFDLPVNLFREIGAARQNVRLRQQDKMLVPVQLPDDLVIAGARGVEIRNAAEVDGGSFPAAHIIAAPLNLRTRLDRDSQDREAMLQN